VRVVFVGKYDLVCYGLGLSNSVGIDVCFDTRLMQDNNWGNRDREKENITNPRNHHLEFACKTLGITT
jgi:hypothetical protein